MSESLNRETAATTGPTAPVTLEPFSQHVGALAIQYCDRPVGLGELLTATRGRGFHLLLILITLPFLTPLPMPGVSLPFGLAVAVVGARMALGQQPWLPARLLAWQIPAGLLPRLVGASGRILRILEQILRPRLAFLASDLVFGRVSGLLIAISGLLLLLPLPIPFSNGLPAGTVVLLSAAALERDGLCFLGGCILFLVTVLFFALLAWGGVEAFDQVLRHLTGDKR